jgi:hypothetical protein
MMIRSRDAWLATIAAVLGASELACKKDNDGPAAAREVPSASASSTAPVVAASAPPEVTARAA